ncbi:MAG: hypothetical protein ABI382_14330 [Nakamurella sp.]
MTPIQPARRPAGSSNRRTPPKIRPSQILAVAVVLAAFLGAVVMGGVIGAAIVALLAIAAGTLLVLRWHALDPRIRAFRAVVVVIGAAVAVSLLLR